MYPKNAASPEPVAIGAVVQISDGAVQTSGCTVRIKPIGVAEGDGGGTTAYSTDGIVLYTPTQAETNYTSFILIAKKTGCIPACVTVVTTASSTPGTVNVASVNSVSTSSVVAVGAYIGNATAALSVNGSGHVSRVTLVDTTTTNTDMITAAGIRTAVGLASANLDTQLDPLPTNAELATALATADDAVLAAIAALNNLSSAGAASAVTTALTTALTEGYRGTGATGSVRDLLYEVIAHLGESSISSTTKTLKKIDGSTTAKVYTLDSATTPTSITETT